MPRAMWPLLFAFVANGCTRSPSFSTAAWLEPARQNDGKRCPMADELVSAKTLLGKNDPQLDALLGPAEKTSYFSGWDRVYWLCEERGLGVDSEWLTLRLDGGVVIEARIQRD